MPTNTTEYSKSLRLSSLRSSSLRLSSLRSVCIAAACAVVGVSVSTVNARALPVFGGPGGANVPSGLRDPQTDLIQGINNDGVALGLATSYSAGVSAGKHGFRWDASGGGVQRFGGLTNASLDTLISAINGKGMAVGSVKTAAALDFHAVRYDPNSLAPHELDSLQASNAGHAVAYAYLLNNAGTIAGDSTLFNGAKDLGTRAVRWDATFHEITALGALNTDAAGLTYSNPVAMNAGGTIAGWAEKYNNAGTADLGFRAVRWAANSTTAFELETLFTRDDGYAESTARRMNVLGTAVGEVKKWSGSNSQGNRAVRWATGGTTATLLDGLGADVNGVSNASVGGLNDAGVTVGTVNKYAANGDSLGSRAVRWAANGTAATELGLLPGVNGAGVAYSAAYGINATGTVAGASQSTNGNFHAAVWLAGGTAPIDLNTLLSPKTGWELDTATGISDTGFVVGNGAFDPDGTGPAISYPESFSILVPQAGTYGRGDANFDTKVDFADLLLLAQHFGQSNTSLDVHVADLNLDGAVNFADLLTLAQHFGSSLSTTEGLSADFAADWALAQSVVPEPTSMVMIGAAIGVIGRRRK